MGKENVIPFCINGTLNSDPDSDSTIETENEYISKKKVFPDYDYQIKGRTELDLTGLDFVRENLARRMLL